jgi:hypothetical protein
MRVARDRRAAFDFTLQLADAPQELVVKLALLEQFLRLVREPGLETGEFFGERVDDGLRITDERCLQLFNVVGEAVNEADDSISALSVNPKDVSLAQ